MAVFTMATQITSPIIIGIAVQSGSLLIGAALMFLVIAPVAVFFVLKSRKNTNKSVQGSKHDAQTEKVKSDIVLAAIDDGVIVINSDQTISVFNKGASQITGWSAEEAEKLVYKSVIKLLDDKGVVYNEEADPFQKVFQSKLPFRDNTAVLATKAGKQVPIHLSVSPLIDTNSTVSSVVGVFRDVTQERAREIQRDEFISTASHEMRTPVAAIEGYLALALNDHVSTIDQKARQYLEKAHTSTQHLGKLFQDLLTSSKAEDGRLAQHVQVVELGSFLSKMSDSLKLAAEKKSLITEYIVGSNKSHETDGAGKVISPLYYVMIDPDRLQEVVTNLFDNAVKYTVTGKVTIGLTGDDNVVQFYIKDTGAGIATEDAQHLFQKFYRLDNSATRSIGGTGLGLFISRKIIELNKGRIWVESELDKGSTFYVNLPRLDSKKAIQLQEQNNTSQPINI